MNTDLIEGFEMLLQASGKSFSVSGTSFVGLLRDLQAPAEAFDLTPGDDQLCEITCLRDSLGQAVPPVGEFIADTDNNRYRIQKLIKRDPIVRFTCIHL